MWSFPRTLSNLRLRKVSTDPNLLCCTDLSDDDVASSSSREEGLECPICWESFNIVENVPYVLWCGHSLCQNCVLALQWTVLKLPAQKIRLPLFVSCPWCNLLSLRWVYRGHLKYPRKNYFILWMVESLNGERSKSSCSLRGDSQLLFSPRRSSLIGSSPTNNDDSRVTRYINVDRSQFSLHKSLDYFLHFAAKFPLVVILLAIIFFIIPGSFAILVMYLLVTVLLALPSSLVLYFAYPTLEWLLREISS